MSKTLFIENSPFLTRLVINDDLKESIQIKQGKNNTLIVKNVPATILNRGNQNGRIYSTVEMQKAIDAAKQQISTKQLLCQADDHPEGSFVQPTHASHVITNAYIKKNVKLEVEGETGKWDVLFCDIEVLNTQEGKNLQALLLSGVSCGTSIRGLGDMEGDQVVNYEFLGFDVVANPSSGTFTNMPIFEAKIESIEANALNEATKFTVSTNAENSTHDLAQAIEFQHNASTLQYGTIVDMGTKMDQEVDPKTGVETTIGEVEIETSDTTSDLQSALKIAAAAFNNPENINVTSITIEKLDDDDEEEKKDSVENSSEQALTEDDEAIDNLEQELVIPNEVEVDDTELETNSDVLQEADQFPIPQINKTISCLDQLIDNFNGLLKDNGNDLGMKTRNELEKARNRLKDLLMADENKKNAQESKKNEKHELHAKQQIEDRQQEESIDEGGLSNAVDQLQDLGHSLGVTDDEVEQIKQELQTGMKIRTDAFGCDTCVYDVVDSDKDYVILTKENGNGLEIVIPCDETNKFNWEEVQESIEEDAEGELTVDDDTLKIDIDGNEIEKKMKTPEEAKIAAAGITSGDLEADIMFDETVVDEKLYKNPTEPSDDFELGVMSEDEEELTSNSFLPDDFEQVKYLVKVLDTEPDVSEERFLTHYCKDVEGYIPTYTDELEALLDEITSTDIITKQADPIYYTCFDDKLTALEIIKRASEITGLTEDNFKLIPYGTCY